MKKTVWSLLDDRIGSVRQIQGITQELNSDEFKIVEKKIGYTWAAKLPNILKGASLLGVDKESRKHLKAPFPRLVISGSRRTAPIARWIKKKSKGRTKIIQLIHPGNPGLVDFDAVFVPEHDRHKKACSNFIYITGAPHRVSERTLEDAAELWRDEFADLPRPLTAVIVGGAIKGRPFSIDNAISLAHEVKKLKNKIGGSVLLTTSRRTGSEPEKVLAAMAREFPHYNYLWGNTGVNPIMGFWALADNIIVTGDSVSMSSESCGSGKPVYIFTGSGWLTKKHMRFVESLYEGGYAAPLNSPDIEIFKPRATLNATYDIVKKIEELFK